MGQSKGGGATQTSQQTNQVPQYVQDAQTNLIGTGTQMTSNFLQNPAYATAGFTPDQMKAMDLQRLVSQGSMVGPSYANMMHMPVNDQNAMSAQMGDLAGRVRGGLVTPEGQTDPYMNQYLKQVGDTTLDAMRREYSNADAGLASKYAAAGAMGGSGEAIARGQAARGYNQDVSKTIANLQSTAFDKANALKRQDVQLEGDLLSKRAGIAASNGDFITKASNLADTEMARKMQGILGLMNMGNAQQALGQKNLDVPFTMLERLMKLTPQQIATQSTKVEPDNTPGIGQQLLGGGMALLGMKGTGGASIGSNLLGAFGLSDRTMKTDIQKLGKDEETGLNLYAYRYKGDAKSGPKVVGPMAQEVQKLYPGAVTEIGGKLAVAQPLLTMLNSRKKEA